MEALPVMGFVFWVVALVREEKLKETLKDRGMLAEDYEEE